MHGDRCVGWRWCGPMDIGGGGPTHSPAASSLRLAGHVWNPLHWVFLPRAFPRFRSSVAQWQSIRLLTGGLLVRVQPEEPISGFATIRQYVERLNVSRRKTSAIERRVRYKRFHETRLLSRILCNIRRIRGLREF